MKWLFLLLLASCMIPNSEVSNITTTPVLEKQAEPLEAEVKLPQETPKEVLTISTNKTLQNITSKGEISCIDDCNYQCETSAQKACTQKERAGCRANCGETIENSACVQACTFLSRPDICKQQFEQFCKAQCVGECY